MSQPQSDRFLTSCKMEQPDCTPVWLMRQAGRYMAEYRALRQKHSFIEMCKTPDLATEVTLQPVLRFDLDAAIIFSDILLPLEEMGVGPPLATRHRPRRRQARPLDRTTSRRSACSTRARPCLSFHAIAHGPLGAFGQDTAYRLRRRPFHARRTILSKGGPPSTDQATKAFMYAEPAAFRLLMEKLTGLLRRRPERADRGRRAGRPGLRQLGRHALARPITRDT